MTEKKPLIHLGIIADGNRRWAKAHNLPSVEGHRKGIDRIDELVKAAQDLGIKFITFFVFSTENWGRSIEEVSYIMKLAETRIFKYAEKLKKNNAKMLILGSKRRIDPKLASKLEEAENLTADCSGITVCFCFNYGGEQEIADAATIASREETEISPETIRKHLYHPEVPNLDLVIRTSGEERISGFMLWRAAYSEFLFLKQYFPDLTGADIEAAVADYNSRSRRFGK